MIFIKEHIETIMALLVAFISATGAVMAAYLKFKAALAHHVQDLKNHSDLSVQKLNGMLTYVINSFDRPCWVKAACQKSDGTIEFRMLEVNNLYCDTFHIPRQKYLGRTDLEAGWGRQDAEAFHAHDLAVWNSGESQTFEEMVNGKPFRFRKLRVQTPDGTQKGVMGYLVDCQEPESCQRIKSLNDKLKKGEKDL